MMKTSYIYSSTNKKCFHFFSHYEIYFVIGLLVHFTLHWSLKMDIIIYYQKMSFVLLRDFFNYMNERRMTLRSFLFFLFFIYKDVHYLYLSFAFLDVAFWLSNIDHNAIWVLLNEIKETFVMVWPCCNKHVFVVSLLWGGCL